MDSRILGPDIAQPVTDELVKLAVVAFGKTPRFWGRYFTSPTTQGNVEYRHHLEDPVLAAHGIRVLPIARQTNHVGGAFALGEDDGRKNATDLLQTFGETYLASQGGRFFIFLDVEGGGVSHLSVEYYSGWAQGLAIASDKVVFLPCVYGIPADSVTWKALAAAGEKNIACHGLWISHPLSIAEPVAWDPTKNTPNPDPQIPVLLWQYMFERQGLPFDRNQVNPSLDAEREFLRFLVPPPGPFANV